MPSQIHLTLKKAFPFLGSRPIKLRDIHDFLEAKNIRLIFTSDITAGAYVLFDGESSIFVNIRLRGKRLLYVLCHEIGHYLFDQPQNGRYAAEFFGLHASECSHFHAEATAAFLLLPPDDLAVALFSGDPIREDMAPLLCLRLQLMRDYKL